MWWKSCAGRLYVCSNVESAHLVQGMHWSTCPMLQTSSPPTLSQESVYRVWPQISLKISWQTIKLQWVIESLYPISIYHPHHRCNSNSAANWRNHNCFFTRGSMLVGSLSSAWERHRNSPNMEDNTEDFIDSRKGSQRLSQPNRTVCTGNDLYT